MSAILSSKNSSIKIIGSVIDSVGLCNILYTICGRKLNRNKLSSSLLLIRSFVTVAKDLL